jgi:hypothetical protein
MSGWGCPHELDGLCQRVRGAYCRPGMRGCVLAGRVEFPDGVTPKPVWPAGGEPDEAPEDGPRKRRKGL